MIREELRFWSNDGLCAASWYVPDGTLPKPVVVMAHGMGCTRELGLDAYAQRFCAAGMCVLAFDYRHYGLSEGQPRELMSVARQQADYRAAIAYVSQRPEVDPSRIALWGYSFSGGHVMALAAEYRDLRAVIAMAPFASGASVARSISPRRAVRLNALALADVTCAALGRPPVYLPLIGADESDALMAGDQHERGYLSIVPEEVASSGRWRNRVAARIALRIPFYEPGRKLRKVHVPILVALGMCDTLAPAQDALRAVAGCSDAEVLKYAAGHFDFFHGACFEQASSDQVSFLRRHLALPEAAAPRLATLGYDWL